MDFKIHRGTKEIGGSCVEVWTELTRLVVDFGMPLVNPDKTQFNSREIKNTSARVLINKGILPNIQSLYDKSKNTALILSHAHQDHYGLINYLHEDCKIYLGKATQKLIELTNIFTNQDWTISNPKHFESGKTFAIGDIEITPYLMVRALEKEKWIINYQSQTSQKRHCLITINLRRSVKDSPSYCIGLLPMR